ncbi:hypothetical protein [Streptomyces sp. NPDC060077]|uniref:hypothetical protein n=1 Tax=Streptomyces sp. NPDC060077 TaxID=3347052 RepID=UPI00365F19AE
MAFSGVPASNSEYLVLPSMAGSSHDGSIIEVALLSVTDAGGREQLAALTFTSTSLPTGTVLPAGEVPEVLTGSSAEAALVGPRPGIGVQKEASDG